MSKKNGTSESILKIEIVKIILFTVISFLFSGCLPAPQIKSDKSIPLKYKERPLDREYWKNYMEYAENPDLFFFSSLGALEFSKLAYDGNVNRDEIVDKLSGLGFSKKNCILLYDAETSTEGFAAANETSDYLIISIKGTAEIVDFIIDFMLLLKRKNDFKGKVHYGFYRAYKTIINKLTGFLERNNNKRRRIVITGHSLGGALAVLVAVKLEDAGFKVFRLYTFGSPRIGDEAFAEYTDSVLDGKYYRFVNHNDCVTKAPPLFYSHAGKIVYFDENKNVQYEGEPLYVDVLRRIASSKKINLKKELLKCLSRHGVDLYRRNIRLQLRFSD